VPIPSAPSSKRIPEERASEVTVAPRVNASGGAKALICPKCRGRFDDTPPAPTQCPKDGIALVRVRELSETPGDPMLGRTLDGRFTILAKLGAGSMGTVYRARQHAMGRDVAVKILRSDRALDDSAKGRFLREARANSLLASANTVTVFDFGQAASGELYLAMELLEGESLGARLTRLGRLSLTDSVDMVRQALRSISEAHAKGIVHRDLKPDNLFFSKVAGGGKNNEEILKVLDFGIAKLVGESNEVMNAVETQAGTVFGTPRYMSPEQAQGKTLDVRSDLYSLGVILYHALTGRPPFMDDDAVVVMARHIKTLPPPMSEACPEAGLPPEVEALVQRLLAKEPAMRPRNAEALAAELAHLVETGIASTSGVRFSLTRSIPPPAMLDGQGAVAPSAQTLALAGVPRRSLKWGMVGFVSALVVAILGLSFRSTSPTSSSPASQTGNAPGATPAATGGASPASSIVNIDDLPPPPDPSSPIPTLSADDLFRTPTAGQPVAEIHETPHSGAHRPPHPGGAAGNGKAGATSASTGNGPAAGGNTAPAPSSAASTGYGYLE
jgi:serine/threonine protein kinase